MTPSTRGTLLVLGAAVLWGTTGTAQSFAPLTLSAYWVGAFRLLVASLFFLIWLLLADAKALSLPRLMPLPRSAMLIAALSMATYNLSFFAGIRTIGVAVGTAVALGSGPVWAGMLQALVSRQLPSMRWWFAVSTAVAGLVIAASSAAATAPLEPAGIALCLLSGASYAVYALATKRVVTQAPATLGTALVFMVAALIALPVAALLAGQPQTAVTDLFILLWLGIIATGLAYLLFGVGLRYISSASGVALALAEPVAAVILAIVVIGERPGLSTLAGMAIVLLGLAMLVRADS